MQPLIRFDDNVFVGYVDSDGEDSQMSAATKGAVHQQEKHSVPRLIADKTGEQTLDREYHTRARDKPVSNPAPLESDRRGGEKPAKPVKPVKPVKPAKPTRPATNTRGKKRAKPRIVQSAIDPNISFVAAYQAVEKSQPEQAVLAERVKTHPLKFDMDRPVRHS